MKKIWIFLAVAMLLGGCGHTSDTKKALEAGSKAEKGAWTRPNTSIQQTRVDYSICGSGILFTKEGFSQRTYENDLSVCLQANVDRERHILVLKRIPFVDVAAPFATLSIERCMDAKGYKKLEQDAIKMASAGETTECMKAKGYEWEEMTSDQTAKPQPTQPASGRTTLVTVTWTSANIRSGAGDEFPVLTTVNKGERLTIIGERGEWSNVRLEDGKEGWIKSIAVK